VEQYQSGIPLLSEDVIVLPSKEKHGKERYGSLIVTIVMVLLVSVFSSRTNIFESSLVIHWADIVKLIPENPTEAFLGFLQAINSSV
jgi:hypothetical protein